MKPGSHRIKPADELLHHTVDVIEFMKKYRKDAIITQKQGTTLICSRRYQPRQCGTRSVSMKSLMMQSHSPGTILA